jgi:hypothetical protein
MFALSIEKLFFGSVSFLNFIMSDIETLNVFYKIFLVFGLQYFSIYDLEPKKSSDNKWLKRFRKIHFVIVLILFSSMITAYVKSAFDVRERITAKTGFNFIIKLFMNFGLIATVMVGVIESFLKTKQSKEIYLMAKEVSAMTMSYFDYKIDYKPFKKSWIIKFIISFSILFLVYGSLVFNNIKNGRKALPLIVAFFPIFFVGLLVFKLTFHYDLVNFQLLNIEKMLSKEVFMKINTTNSINIRHILQSRALGFRKIYNMVYDMSECVNNFLASSALFIVIVLTVVVINSSFNCIVILIKYEPISKVSRKIYKS